MQMRGTDNLSEMENITIPDEDLFQNVLEYQGPKFKQLVSICKPPHTQNWALCNICLSGEMLSVFKLYQAVVLRLMDANNNLHEMKAILLMLFNSNCYKVFQVFILEVGEKK